MDSASVEYTDECAVSDERTSMKATNGILDLSNDMRTFVSATKCELRALLTAVDYRK